MGARRWLWGGAAAVVLALPALWAALPAAPAGPPAPPSSADAPAGPGSPRFAGTAGCSARGCHGAIHPALDRPVPDCLANVDPASLPVVRQNEYTLWLARDKHAEAYGALHGQLGQAILKKLYGEDAAPESASACLACHANPLAARGDALLFREERSAGVGCESCHGGAVKWLAVHTSEQWKCYSREKKRDEYGMTPLGDPAALAATCVGCHVGAPADDANGLPARDMNHDMIAAGHPRLTFELAVFLANLPPHWDDKAKQRDPCFEATAWAVGQAATTRAALNLLADRAKKEAKPWPEFAEYNCYACHHDLSDPSWRQDPDRFGGRRPGSLAWGTWVSTIPAWLAEQDAFQAPTFAADLDALEKAMRTPLKDRDKLAGLAERLARNPMWDKVAGWKCKPEEVRKLLAALAAEGPKAPGGPAPDWDAAEQLYLAAAALGQVQGAERSQKELNEVVRQLAFPRDPQEFHSPRGYRPEDFLPLFRRSVKSLAQ